jgi:phage replication initiation protein
VDFRQIPKDAEDEERYRAPVLEWYALLTEGFQKGRLAQEKQVQTLQNVKRWVSDTLTPMLAVICATPGGEEWLLNEIVRGIAPGGRTDTGTCSSGHPIGFTRTAGGHAGSPC